METGAACSYFKRKKSKRGGPILQKGQSHFAIAQQIETRRRVEIRLRSTSRCGRNSSATSRQTAYPAARHLQQWINRWP